MRNEARRNERPGGREITAAAEASGDSVHDALHEYLENHPLPTA